MASSISLGLSRVSVAAGVGKFSTESAAVPSTSVTARLSLGSGMAVLGRATKAPTLLAIRPSVKFLMKRELVLICIEFLNK